MPTTFTAEDAFNLAEIAAVATVNDDAWLGDTDNVVTVHQKVWGNADPDTPPSSYQHELPDLGILAVGGPQDDKQTFGEFVEQLRLRCDVWCGGADFDGVDAQVKTILARYRRLMRLQAFSPDVHAESSQLDGYLGDGTIDNEEWDIVYHSAADEDEGSAAAAHAYGGWLVHGVSYAKLTIISED